MFVIHLSKFVGKVPLGAFGKDKGLDNALSSSLSAQCWISSVRDFVNLQDIEIQKTARAEEV